MYGVDYISRGKYESRILQIKLLNKKLTTPVYFPSISSAATRMQLDSLIEFCINKNYPRLLISAFDLDQMLNGKKSMVASLKKYQKNNFLFMDSGTFESYWLKKKWNYKKYQEIIKICPGDFYASFDEIPNPEEKSSSLINTTIKHAKNSSTLSKSVPSFTVVHGNNSRQLIEIIEYMSKNTPEYLPMIAIPEKDCGKTIENKITTIKKIRKIMSKNNPTNILHILGCGNPLSIAMYAFAGADSFDSNDWSRWIINPKTLQLMDQSHIELLNCSCEICKRKNLDSTNKGLLHNLLFYQNFTQGLQMHIIKNDGLDFLKEFVDRKIFSKIVKFF